MANSVAIHELHSVVLFRQKFTVMKTDLNVARILISFSGAKILWETPMNTPLFMKSDFEDKLTSYRVTGHLLDKQTIMNQGMDMPGSTRTLGTGMPYVSSEEFRKSSNKEAVELHGNYFLAWAARQRGYINEITYSNGTHAYSVKVQFEDSVVEMMNITLQQFIGTFEILTRNAKTLEVAQSSTRCCWFKTTELLVCSTHGVMTVTNVTKAVPKAEPVKATLLDRNFKP
ncbi:hypothetical protein AOLI_G00109270 [Acnodon oligacanthus]